MKSRTNTPLPALRARRRALALGIGFAIAAIVGWTPWRMAEATPELQRGGDRSACSDIDPETGLPLSSRVITPSHILDCETATISMTLKVSCEAVPLHVMLVIDRSGSMIGQPIQDVKAAARALVDVLERANNPNIQVGLISHGIRPTSDLRLTDDLGRARGKISSLQVNPSDIEDNLPDAITEAKNQIVRERPRTGPPPVEVMVVLSDGGQTFPPQNAVRSAGAAKAQNILIVSVCTENGASDCNAMRSIASSARYYRQARGTSGLTKIFQDIADDIIDINLRSLTVVEPLPAGVSLVPDSIVPDTGDYDARTHAVEWDLRFIPKKGEELAYQVRPSAVTTYTFGLQTTIDFRDSSGAVGSIALPTGVLTVTAPCDAPPPSTEVVPPDPSDTPTHTPTHTPSATPSPTSTPTDTPTPTATPTPIPQPIYLPILNLARCLVKDLPVDIVLVVDASSSMRVPTLGGRPRIEAAQEGARRFVALKRTVDRVAVVAFNEVAVLASGLSGDREALYGAIDAIETAAFTRIDLALDAAGEELRSERARPDAERVVILMTDGQPSQTTSEAVRRAGEALQGLATVYVIGVGGDIDVPLMIDVAGDASRYYPVDDAEALGRIYEEIARRTQCDD